MTEQLPNIRVLAVDDEPNNGDLIRRVLHRERRFALDLALSGQDGLAMLAKSGAFDVLLVDYSMPMMSGVQFLEAAQKIVPQASTIMVTAFPELDEVMAAQQRGLVRHILAKPWRAQELIKIIDRTLSMRDLKRTLSRFVPEQE